MSAVDHPGHYEHPSGVECIDVVEWENFCIGNAIKYLWRAGRKDALLQDLEKARWYVDREITRLKKQGGHDDEQALTPAGSNRNHDHCREEDLEVHPPIPLRSATVWPLGQRTGQDPVGRHSNRFGLPDGA